MPKKLSVELSDLQQQVEKIARAYGLDFFQTSYEILDFDEINMVASYMGFPTRYPHWKWGMEYERLSKSYTYGLSKIYELVINNDPCYAYLLESNSFVDQKMVMCHVIGHNDFFKNNFVFKHANRRMIDEMANHACRIRRYMEWYGVEKVELFIDNILSLENMIDYHAPFIVRQKEIRPAPLEDVQAQEKEIGKLPTDREYMENYINPEQFVAEQKKRLTNKNKKEKQFPKVPERDVLQFLIKHAPFNRWQQDVADMLREEAYYFAPQAMTKVMNEGWASYWHTKLMTHGIMQPSEVVDFAERHACVVEQAQGQLNPYKLGLELFRDIEERWDKGQFGREWDNCASMAERRSWDRQLGLGMKKIFQVRALYNDVTFIDEFLTADFCKKQGFFSYGYDKKKQEFTIESREFNAVKNKLMQSLTNLGQPIIQVVDGNFENRSELLLEHVYDGIDLQIHDARETLKNLWSLWSRPVHILTTYEDKKALWSFDGRNWKERFMA